MATFGETDGSERRSAQTIDKTSGQYSGSMTFWCGSLPGSADPCLRLMEPDSDPDPAIFVIDLQDANKKLIFVKKLSFSAYYFMKVHLHHFSKIKSPKEVTKQ